MSIPRPTAGPKKGWLLSLLLFAVVGLCAPPTAHADNSVAKSSPEAGGNVDTSPEAIEIVFTETLGASNQVTMTCGSTVMNLSPPQLLVDGVTLRIPLNAPAPKGTCTVAWTVTDVDLQANGSGAFTFNVLNDTVTPVSTIVVGGATTTTTTIVSGTATATGGGGKVQPTPSGGTGGVLAVFRLLSTIAIAVLLGSMVVIAVAWPEGVEYIITVKFLRNLWFVALGSTYLFNVTLAANLTESNIFGKVLPFAWGGMFDFTPGLAGFLRLVFVGATGYAVMRPERIIDNASQLPAFVPAVIAVATFGFDREAFGGLDFTLGTVHALAMAVWFGGVVFLARVVLAGPGDEDLVQAVRGFSKISTPALVATVLTGMVQFFRLDRGAIGSAHGVVVVLKTLAVAGMVFVAVAARQFINQRLTHAPAMNASTAFRLRRALSIEMLVGVLVLAITAGLMATVPPRLANSMQKPLDIAAPHLFQNQALGITVTVAFSEKVGVNDVRVEVTEVPLVGLADLAVDFIPPVDKAVNGMVINVPLTQKGAAVLRKSSGFSLGASGLWTLRVRTGSNTIAEMQVQVTEATTIITTPISDTTTTPTSLVPVVIGGTTTTDTGTTVAP